MIEKINLGGDTFIYRAKITISNIDQLISDINLNLDVSIDSKKPTQEEPGIQSTIVISTPLIRELGEKIRGVFSKTFDLPEDTPYSTMQWSYISDRKNVYSALHKHDLKSMTNLVPKWTYTYYVQMPDNLVGDDGKLVFRPDDGPEYMILPEIGDLLIFPASIMHAPLTNTSSNLERIVIGGIWNYIDKSDKIRKKEKTLM